MRSRVAGSRKRREEGLHRRPLARGSRPAGNRNVPATAAGSRGRRACATGSMATPQSARRLRDRGGDRVVRLRLVGVAGRPRAREQLVDQHARAGAGIAVDHQRGRIGERRLERLLRALPSKRASPGRNRMPCMRCQPRTSARPGVDQMHIVYVRSPDRSDAPARCRIRRGSPPPRRRGCRPPSVRAEKPRSASAPTTTSSATSWLPMMTRSGARAALPISVTSRDAVGIERGGERVDLEETVGLREAGHRAGALAGRERDRAVLAVDQRHQHEFLAAELGRDRAPARAR